MYTIIRVFKILFQRPSKNELVPNIIRRPLSVHINNSSQQTSFLPFELRSDEIRRSYLQITIQNKSNATIFPFRRKNQIILHYSSRDEYFFQAEKVGEKCLAPLSTSYLLPEKKIPHKRSLPIHHHSTNDPPTGLSRHFSGDAFCTTRFSAVSL